MAATGVHTVIVVVACIVVFSIDPTVTFAVNGSFSIPIPPIPAFPKENVTTGNKILFEQTEDANPDALDDGQFMEVNELPVRYDEAQLWRIYNISRLPNVVEVTQQLEHHFGGNVWKENLESVDISFQKENAIRAKNYLRSMNLSPVILHDNIQDLFDQETAGSAPDFASKRAKKAIALRRMNWDEYQDVDIIYEFMKEIRIAYPSLCRLYTIGKTAEGRELKVMRISTNPRENKKIWIDGGIHAREWISPAVVTYILYNLISNWSALPNYMTSKTWYVMPVMNPDGYMYSRKTNRLWRKNRSKSNLNRCFGVDLNRNFNINWQGPGSSSQPCSDTYRGASPASELETRAVVAFLSRRKTNLDSYLTFHSYGELIVYPWAYKTAKVKDFRDLQKAAQLAANNVKQETGRSYRAGATYELLGVAGGGSDDWCRATLGTKYVYTVELRDKGYYGFVLPKSQIKATAKEGYIIADTIASVF